MVIGRVLVAVDEDVEGGTKGAGQGGDWDWRTRRTAEEEEVEEV